MKFTEILRSAFRDIWTHRYLATTLAIRDTKAKYRGSFLGFFWAVFPPLAAAIGLAAAKGAGVISFGETAIPFPAYIIFSMSLWQLFTAAITRPISALLGSKALLTKVDFPREVIIISEISKLLVFAFAQTILVVGVFIFFKVEVNSLFYLSVIPVLVFVLLGLTISLLIAPFALLFGDISSALPLALGGVFFITPVVYVLPKEGGLFSFVVRHNPLTTIIEFCRELVYSSHSPVFLYQFIIVTLLTLPIACMALVFFRIAMPIVVERWSA